MDALGWTHRPLIVFVPADSSDLIAAQRAALADQAGAMRERDMVHIEVAGDTVRVDGRPQSDPDADGLRRRFSVGPDEAVVLLVGKDGGAKLRRDRAFSAAELFATIDAMPMRRAEQRRSRRAATAD